MSSLLTSMSAMSAIRSLIATQKSLTGPTMRPDRGVLSTVGDLTTAVDSTHTRMSGFRADPAAAQAPHVTIQVDLKALLDSLKSIATSASFNGLNVISFDASGTRSEPTTMVSSNIRTAAGIESLGIRATKQ